MKIALSYISPKTSDGTVVMRSEDALKVTGGWQHEHAWQANHVWFLLHMQTATGHVGPFTADDIQRISFEGWQPGHQPTPSIADIEHGMRRLLSLDVVKETTEE